MILVSILLSSVSSILLFLVSSTKVNRESKSIRARQTLECFCCSSHPPRDRKSADAISSTSLPAPPPDPQKKTRSRKTSCAESIKLIIGVGHELASTRLWHGSQDCMICIQIIFHSVSGFPLDSSVEGLPRELLSLIEMTVLVMLSWRCNDDLPWSNE
jgi:hypothetical protein